MLKSTVHEFSTAHKKVKYRQMKGCLALSLSDVVFTMLIDRRLCARVFKISTIAQDLRQMSLKILAS